MSGDRESEVVVVHNPAASGADRVRLHAIMQTHFADRRVDFLESHTAEDLMPRLTASLAGGSQLVIAAGGDGTVSDVASALVQSHVPLGILPLGTGNVVARELEIPIDADEAARLLAGRPAFRRLDVLRVGNKAYLLTVGVGLGAEAMRDTTPGQKKRFGKWAYWFPFIRNFFSPPTHNFHVELDGRPLQIRASELHAVNVGALGFKALRWGPEVQPDDGIMDLCSLRARTGLDYLWAVLNVFNRRYLPNKRLTSIPSRESIRILQPEGLDVQADGDWIGVTPVEVRLEPAALLVAVPSKGGGS